MISLFYYCNVSEDGMFIQTEVTPNPNTLKFFPGGVVMKSGTIDFNNAEEASSSYLAQALFEITDIKGVFFSYNFISVTKEESADWSILKPEILMTIMSHFVDGKPLFSTDKDLSAENDEEDEDYDDADSELVVQIKELIETRVRPAVAQDGGDIIFRGYRDGVVTLKLQGACSGCPSSTLTLKGGIENMLRYYIPQVELVEAA
jgi:Fe-S cluster biogenesis protein NfuA